MKKIKGVTVLSIEYAKRVCDPQPQFIDRMDVRRLVMTAYRKGYSKADSECKKRMYEVAQMELSDIDSPVFTHTREFENHFKYIKEKIIDILFKTK